MTIYYDSKTGNVERFITKVKALTSWNCVKISEHAVVTEPGHLVTHTTQIGKVPLTTSNFLDRWHTHILSVSSSGNMNWGNNFAVAADSISHKFNIPLFLKFELAGLDRDVKDFIQKVKKHAN